MTMDKCGLCGEEAPQLETVVIRTEVECCPQCVLDSAAVNLAEKPGRRRAFLEASYKWADELDGKAVLVHWDADLHPAFCSSRSAYHVGGVAHRLGNASGGWGEVRIDISPSENSRIRPDPRHPGYGEIDGMRYGLFLNSSGDGNWYVIVSWGGRGSLSLFTKET